MNSPKALKKKIIKMKGGNLDSSKSLTHCSPASQKFAQKENFTCFSKNSLIQIAKTYNNTNLNTNSKINLSSNKLTLHKNIKEKMNNICNDNEACWISQNNKHLEKKTFRPNKPCAWYDNQLTWLNTTNIEDVVKQYEDVYPDFNFVGVFPIDFNEKTSMGQCISQEICNLNIERIYKSNIKKLGFIFNLDRHDEDGSHWVALYICLDPNNINYGAFFYDSATSGFPPEIHKFMTYISGVVNKINTSKKFAIHKNTKKHQFKNTECGMFSMFFIIQCLKDIKASDVANANIKDESVMLFRDIYYKPNLSCNK
jgi:hypothetical protein